MQKDLLVATVFLSLLGVFSLTENTRAQEVLAGEQVKRADEWSGITPPANTRDSHQLWDKTNLALFAAVGVTRALDFASTQHFRRLQRGEILLTNGIVDNKPLFAAIEAAGAVASIGVSYWLHRTGHHKLERWVSIIHVGVGTLGAARNYSLDRAPGGSPLP